MGWRGGETPLAILFFFLREKRDVSGSDFFGAYYGVKKSSLTPLIMGLPNTGAHELVFPAHALPSESPGDVHRGVRSNER